MTLLFRLMLFFMSLLSIVFFLYNIRKAKMRVDDSLFWIIFASLGIVLSIFPGILIWFAGLFGIISPVNFLFLALLFILIIRNFSLTVKLSQLQMKLNKLGQDYAMEQEERERESTERRSLSHDEKES